MKYVELNDGNQMPQLGFGVFQVSDLNQAEQAVSDALDTGYRLIDTAAAYGNEEAVGVAIKKSGIDRKEIFVTSKLWVDHFTYEKAQQGIDESLTKLGLDYIDLYLLHQPYGDVAGAWRALIEAKEVGKIKSIGVSNFAPDQLMNLELMSEVKPAVNQIEVSPWYQESEAVDFAQAQNVQVEAWAPFAEGKHNIFSNETIAEIGQKYGKSNGQIILRWLLQRGIVVIPKSVHKTRMAENINVFDFELSDDDMQKMNSLDKNESQFFDHRDPKAIESIFGESLKALRK
ncbi:aldo/keto reductase [Pediococcus acidilactici]|jgi:diketogulonate reductase-like aldo/keto reductase|uniref:aldo/keto reductase n=1 Tax=Pediococcus acidilactici TaxID=1254 RepID=UPI0006B591B3|nr:aldo/keto reductase [Pediococcus acidilactici]KAF0373277.1 aldo/keto reductase [Pediococcus acidilactici]KAF0383531.1 aldo/keto reductase [Pediococcus acidilactici]KAF0457515.1 aldo/keto reductase [Pediococcus acidilactici]KAF0477050.1 aldo/keto reductase [Pediococcus acidilactici]KAF0537575.1 aldo/keto reductase [Pediococcus acidilactici]